MADAPIVSIVVPTRNRRAMTLRLLEALSRQRVPCSIFEVVVAVDGSSDDTATALRERQWPFRLQVVELPASGPGNARNEGARRALGRILLFLDDDVEPNGDTVAAHAALHASTASRVGIGMLPPVVGSDSLFSSILRFWWSTMQEIVCHPGHRFSFTDLLSGHFSIVRSEFDALGGFDTGLRCHEDYELGFRAIQAGLEFKVATGAEARHHDDSTVHKVMRRKFEEGVADVALGRRYPALVRGLPFAWEGRTSRRRQALRRLAWSRSTAGDAFAAGMQRLLPVYEAASLRFRWRVVVEALLDYWYWSGVASVLRNPAALRSLLATASPEPSAMVVDLSSGVAAAEAVLDRHRPAAARLMLGDDIIATVPAYPGYEPLRGVHLRPLLARWCPGPYLQAARRHGQVPALLIPLVDQIVPE
jgi:glycosyltransferase involved in cell wall biosynthesis